MKLLLKIAFDGTEFHGYQFQPSHRTVQGTLTETLSELFGEPVNVTGCSRTDSGVHASYFVAAIEPKSEDSGDWLRIPPSKIHRAANDLLPRDISVLGAFPVEDTDFHPRYSVVSKEYVYRIDDSLAPQPFMRNYVYAHRRPISDAEISDMDSAAQRFVGKHDFTSYMAAGSKITDAERCVYSASVKRNSAGLIEFRVCADGFLYNMVRIMAGTMIEVAKGRLSPADTDKVTEAKNREAAGETLPPSGLCLCKVTYPFEIGWLAD